MQSYQIRRPPCLYADDYCNRNRKMTDFFPFYRSGERVHLDIQRNPCFTFIIVLSKTPWLRCWFPKFVVFILCAVIKVYSRVTSACCLVQYSSGDSVWVTLQRQRHVSEQLLSWLPWYLPRVWIDPWGFFNYQYAMEGKLKDNSSLLALFFFVALAIISTTLGV